MLFKVSVLNTQSPLVGCVIPSFCGHNDNQDVIVIVSVANADVWVASPGKYA